MEQRRAPRFVVEGIQGTMTSASQVEILNMSISGAAIRLDRNLRVGGEYSLRLELNDTVLAVKGASRSQNMPAMMIVDTTTSRVRLAAMPA